MRFERYAWLAIALIFAATSGILMRQKAALEHAFLAGDFFNPIKSDAVSRFKRDEGISEQKVDDMFFVSYAYFQDRVCIRFVPRPTVYGGVTSYCYQDHDHNKLLGIDRTGA